MKTLSIEQMRARKLWRAIVQRNPCPACGVAAFKNCKRESGKKRQQPHIERVRIARPIRKEELV